MFLRNVSSNMDYTTMYPKRWQHSTKFVYHSYSIISRGNAIGITTGYELEDLGSEFESLGSTKPPIQ
jgi:hypothetical protein